MFILWRRFGRALTPFLATVCICAVATSCAGTRTSSGANGSDEVGRKDSETGVENSVQTPTVTTSLEPPGSTLSHDGETVDGGLGGYCWATGGGGTCVDAVGVILEWGAIEAPAGATLSFAYKGRALDSLSVAAYRAGREGEDAGRDDVFVAPSKGGRAKDLRVRRSGTRARIPADLPAGEYVLNAFARMPQGDASYGFRLILEPRDPGGP